MSDKANYFETVHLVNGQNVKTLSDGQLIDAIKGIENAIHQLGSVQTKSTKIDAKIAELEVQKSEIVKILDARP